MPTLQVKVAAARNLVAADANGKSDPYVTLTISSNKKSKQKTKVIKRTLNPEWNQDFQFTVTATDSLEVQVYDQDVTSDEKIGNTVVTFGELVLGQPSDSWIPLENVDRGEIHLIITAVDFGQTVKQAAKAAPAPLPVISNVPVGTAWSWKDQIGFTGTISVTTANWMELQAYTRAIHIPHGLAWANITYHIPFVGNAKGKSRSRVRLNFDNTPICDASKFGQAGYELHEITLTGLVQNVAPGPHTLTVHAMVDTGELCIPYYDAKLVEATQVPPIAANAYMFGFA